MTNMVDVRADTGMAEARAEEERKALAKRPKMLGDDYKYEVSLGCASYPLSPIYFAACLPRCLHVLFLFVEVCEREGWMYSEAKWRKANADLMFWWGMG